MAKILITAPYMHQDRVQVAEYLKDLDHEIIWIPVKERLEEHDLLAVIGEADGIICGDDKFSAKVYEAARNLKVVVKWGTGIDSIQAEEAKKRGIIVCRTPGAFTNPVSDSTLSYMLAFCRRTFDNDAVLKSGGWEKPDGKCISEATIGLIGFGEIGRAVARRLNGFDADVYVNDIRTISEDEAKSLSVKVVSRDFIFKNCDIITLHADLNATSYHIVNEETISQMRPESFVINTARGPLIDEDCLIQALKSKKISGAALDVFEKEPLPIDSPLRKMSTVLLAAHNSNSSHFYWDKVHKNSIKLIKEVLG